MRLQCYYVASFGQEIENWEIERDRWNEDLNLPFTKPKPKISIKNIEKKRLSIILEDIETFYESSSIENVTNIITLDGESYCILISFDELSSLISEIGDVIIDKLDNAK